MRETPGLLAICKELERLSPVIVAAMTLVGNHKDENEIAALLKHNREAIKIYEGER